MDSDGPETQVRVLSTSTTFYPVEKDGQAQKDNLPLVGLVLWLKRQMQEDFQFFTAGDLFVVLQQWRDIVFFIQSKDARKHEVMRLQLQKVREILIFLFGSEFDSVMKNNISLKKRQLFAQYVDSYLAACESDYIYLLNALRIDDDCKKLGQWFMEVTKSISPEFQMDMLSCILFHNHSIVARFAVPGAVQFEPESYSLLSVLEMVEYETVEEVNKGTRFDPHYVCAPDNPTMKRKNAHLRMEHTPVCCTLTSTRLAHQSPFVMLVVTRNQKIQPETQAMIVEFMKTVAERLMENPMPEPEPEAYELPVDLLHYVVVNRTSGDVMELPNDMCVRLFQERCGLTEEDAVKEAARVKNHLAAYGMSAMVRGFTMMMRGEFNYQFCYEMRFENEDHELMKPTQVFTPPPFNDDTGINYQLITDTIFQSAEHVTCIELFSVYVGKIQVKTAMASNQFIYEMYQKSRKQK